MFLFKPPFRDKEFYPYTLNFKLKIVLVLLKTYVKVEIFTRLGVNAIEEHRSIL